MQDGSDGQTATMMPTKRAGDLLLVIFFAGVVGEVVLEVIAWFVSPMVVGMPMRPHLLIEAIGTQFFGLTVSTLAAVTVHLLLGAVVMPLVYVGLRQALGWQSWFWASVAWGVILWLIAQAVLAPLAGRPVFLGFIPYSWGSLAAHVIYAVTVGCMFEDLRKRFLGYE